MKTKLQLMSTILLLSMSLIYGQSFEQLGGDIDGQAELDTSGASVSINTDGSRVAIGSPNADGNGNQSGTVRIYELNASDQWIQVGADITGEAIGDKAGASVSISGNGNRVAIGAPFNDDNGNLSGQVRIYELNASNQWVQLGGDIDGEAEVNQSGTFISLSSDGTIVAINSTINDDNGNDSGHVRIYQLNASNQWVQLGSDIDGEAANDNSGSSVSMSSNGTTVAIGATGNDGNGNGSGHVRIFQLNATNQWVQLGDDIDGEIAGDRSGASVSLNSDGTTVAIGATFNDDSGNLSGHVRVFQLNPSNQWVQLGGNISGEAADDQSGSSVSISNDGTRVAIGAPFNDGNGDFAGHVRIYELTNSNQWVQLGIDIDGEAQSDASGAAISMSGDGKRIAIGARLNDGNGASSGHVRIYKLFSTPVAIAPIPPNLFEDTTDVPLGDDIEITDVDNNDQTVTFTITGGALTIGDVGITFSEGSNGSSSFKAQGTLAAINTALDAATFTPTPNLSGGNAATIEFVSNNGFTNSNTASITPVIIPVNDAPIFTLRGNVGVFESSSANIPGYAISIDDGDPEATQALTFNTSFSGNPFSVAPAIDPTTGDLTFTLADGVIGNIDITVTLTDDGGTANGGVNQSSDTFQIQITATNDAPVFNLPAAPNQTVNEDAGVQTVNGFASGIDDGDTDMIQALTFNVSNNNNALFSIQPSIDPATGNLTYTPAANANGVATITVNLSDDAGTANGGADTSENQTFIITVNPVNDTPVFALRGNIGVFESSSANIPGYAISIDDGDPEVTQALTFNTSFSGNPFSVAPAIDATTGDLTFTLADDVIGNIDITVTLTDDGGTANGGVNQSTDTFQIQITATNDAPIFNLPAVPNQIVNENAGIQIVNGFASGIDDGDSDMTQALMFNVSNNNNSLFSVQPSIDTATGNLTYTPAINTTGTATVTVNLSDDGGTANGGVDTSANQTFTITIEDQTRPTVTITSPLSPGPTGENPIPITITFSESVNDFTLTDISSNVSFGNLNGSGAIYTIDVIPSVLGAITVDIAENRVTDDAGNGNVAASQFSINYDPFLNIEDVALDSNNITFYPNPAKNSINFSVEEKLQTVKVFSLDGKLVLSQNLQENSTVNISKLSKGTYILNIKTLQGVTSRKLIKE
ncbi:T9SS type A sorting domain-containing protein [Aquimarina sp. 2201CG5-10]|uniref:T9SS type A sorting domain-containing protein n=1 Tax=Aquimarina callyspongiae TaxID=3098150 RepID=UPI002AB4F315|nr:T9SS type A sorting domain-containing protein [Aquimarina sp. 2201CG5-10]MDY8136249.1 T9SS type A sorting domain-containing protein [Aquimarina sp. 2201CG5-10]